MSQENVDSVRTETPMAAVVVEEVPGGNQRIYEEVDARVMPEGQLPVDAWFISLDQWTADGASSRERPCRAASVDVVAGAGGSRSGQKDRSRSATPWLYTGKFWR